MSEGTEPSVVPPTNVEQHRTPKSTDTATVQEPSLPDELDRAKAIFAAAIDDLPDIRTTLPSETEFTEPLLETLVAEHSAADLFARRQKLVETLKPYENRLDSLILETEKCVLHLRFCNVENAAGLEAFRAQVTELRQFMAHVRVVETQAERVAKELETVHYAWIRRRMRDAGYSNYELHTATMKLTEREHTTRQELRKLKETGSQSLIGRLLPSSQHRDEIRHMESELDAIVQQHDQLYATEEELERIRKHRPTQLIDDERTELRGLRDTITQVVAQQLHCLYQPRIRQAKAEEARQHVELTPEEVQALNQEFVDTYIHPAIAKRLATLRATGEDETDRRVQELQDPQRVDEAIAVLLRSFALPMGRRFNHWNETKEEQRTNEALRTQIDDVNQTVTELQKTNLELMRIIQPWLVTHDQPANAQYSSLQMVLEGYTAPRYRLEADYRRFLTQLSSLAPTAPTGARAAIKDLDTHELARELLQGTEKDIDVKRWKAMRAAPVIRTKYGEAAVDNLDLFMQERVVQHVLTLRQHTDESIRWGKKLFEFTALELIPLQLVTSYRESGSSGEYPFIGMTRGPQDSPLAQRLLALTPDDLDGLDQLGIPNLRETVDLIRLNSSTFPHPQRQGPAWEENYVYQVINRNIESIALHLAKSDPAHQQFALDYFEKCWSSSLSPETVAYITGLDPNDPRPNQPLPGLDNLVKRLQFRQDETVFIALSTRIKDIPPSQLAKLLENSSLLEWAGQQALKNPAMAEAFSQWWALWGNKISQKPSGFIEKFELITSLEQRIPTIPTIAWTEAYRQLLATHGRSARAEYDPWVKQFDPLVKEAIDQQWLDPAQALDGQLLQEFVTAFGMHHTPTLLNWYLSICRADAEHLLDPALAQAMEAFGVPQPVTTEQFVAYVQEKQHSLITMVLDDQLPSEEWSHPVGEEFVRATMDMNSWQRPYSLAALSGRWRTTVEAHPELATLPDGYRVAPLLVHQISEQDLSLRNQERKQAVLANPDVVSSLEHYRTAYADVADIDIPTNPERATLWWEVQQAAIATGLARLKHQLDTKQLSPTLGDDERSKALAQRGKQLDALAEIGSTVVGLELTAFPTDLGEQDKLIVTMIEQLATVEKRTNLQGKIPALDQALLALSALHTLLVNGEAFRTQIAEVLRLPSGTVTEDRINQWNTILVDRIHEHYLHPQQQKHQTEHIPFSKLARQRLASAWQLPKQLGDNQVVLARTLLDTINASAQQRTGDVTRVDLVPVRGLGRMYAGDYGDACYSSKQDELAEGKYPNLTAFLFVTEREMDAPRIQGSTLAIETKLADGQTTLLVRANNPQQRLLLDVSSTELVEQTLERMVALAQARGIDSVVLPLDPRSASSSNRSLVTDGYYLKHFTQNPKVDLIDEPATNFNGYNNWQSSGPNPCVVIWTKEKGRIGWQKDVSNYVTGYPSSKYTVLPE